MSEENTKDLTLDEKLDLLLAEVREVKVTVGNLDTRLGALETKVEDRLHDTRPLWQRVQQQIQDLKTEVQDLKTEANARFESIEKELRHMNRRFEVFSMDTMKMRADIRDFDERLIEVERKPM
jgi:SMC interacting uncharacterized protein involved in chromosome segregation